MFPKESPNPVTEEEVESNTPVLDYFKKIGVVSKDACPCPEEYRNRIKDLRNNKNNNNPPIIPTNNVSRFIPADENKGFTQYRKQRPDLFPELREDE